MTREEAIKILQKEIDEDIFIFSEYREMIHEAMNMGIKALNEQIDREHHIQKGTEIFAKIIEDGYEVYKWIPVSEKLPNEGDMVLVTRWAEGHILEGYRSVEIAWRDKEEWYTYGQRPILEYFAEKVVAWMPLPDPYKGGDEE